MIFFVQCLRFNASPLCAQCPEWWTRSRCEQPSHTQQIYVCLYYPVDEMPYTDGTLAAPFHVAWLCSHNQQADSSTVPVSAVVQDMSSFYASEQRRV